MTKLVALTRKHTVGFITLALVLAASTGVAIADTNNPSKPEASKDCPRGYRDHNPFARFDKDGDNKIILKELPAKAQAHLTTIDANKDGTLTREEFDRGREQLRALREKELDTNKDGTVSDDERKAGRGKGKGPRNEADRKAYMQKRFNDDDKNKDGYLVQTEAPERWDHLKTADTNSDSKVSLAELQAAHDSGKMRPNHRGQGRGNRQGQQR